MGKRWGCCLSFPQAVTDTLTATNDLLITNTGNLYRHFWIAISAPDLCFRRAVLTAIAVIFCTSLALFPRVINP